MNGSMDGMKSCIKIISRWEKPKTRNLGGGAKFFDSHCTAVIANGGNSIHGEH